jgi:DNA-binding NtrC family response regulator
MRRAIICVEDEAILLMCMKQDLMAHYGDRFVYETARNAIEAIEVMEELVAEGIDIALVISDWLMPGMKGDALLAEVRRRHVEARAILVSGQVDDEAVSRLRAEIGLSAFIEKPWRRERLFDEIDRCEAG